MLDRIPLDYERQQNLKYVRSAAEGAYSLYLIDSATLRPTERGHVDDFDTAIGVLVNKIAWNLLGWRTEEMSYEDIIDECTLELGEEMDGIDG